MKTKGMIVIKMAGLALAGAAVATLGGCAAATGGALNASGTETAGGIHLRSKMSSSIFLQPVSPTKQVVFVEGHNTSSESGLNFKPEMVADLRQAGYAVTADPDKAQFMLVYNIRYVGKQTANHTFAGVLAGGYGGLLAGALATNGSHYQDLAGNMAGAGILGMAIGAGAGYLNRTDTYLMVVDIQLEQRDAHAKASTTTAAAQGTSSAVVSTGGGFAGWDVYRDRVAVKAWGRRLSFTNAMPALSTEMSREISGLF